MLTQVGVKQLTDFLRTVTAASDLVDCTLVNCGLGSCIKRLKISICYYFVLFMHFMMLDIVLFGHSFIRHFERFVNEDDSRHNLGLDPSQFRIRFKNLSGLNFVQQQWLQYDKVVVRGAGIVYFDIGTNDLADPNYDPKTFARD